MSVLLPHLAETIKLLCSHLKTGKKKNQQNKRNIYQQKIGANIKILNKKY